MTASLDVIVGKLPMMTETCFVITSGAGAMISGQLVIANGDMPMIMTFPSLVTAVC